MELFLWFKPAQMKNDICKCDITHYGFLNLKTKYIVSEIMVLDSN